MRIQIAGSTNSGSTAETRVFAARASNAWKRLHSEFMSLREEEDRLVHQRTIEDRLYAYFTCQDSGEIGGCWWEGITSERLAARFELLGTEGGIALGAPRDTSPLNYWLACLLVDLRAHKSNHLRMYNESTGHIERLLEVSALFCTRLERRSLEGAANTVAASESPVLDESTDERSARRCAVVMPILRSKNWTRCRWVTEAGVSKNSVYDYLSGKRNLSPANLKALAEVLGLRPEEFPD
jgi:hypothetical protein